MLHRLIQNPPPLPVLRALEHMYLPYLLKYLGWCIHDHGLRGRVVFTRRFSFARGAHILVVCNTTTSGGLMLGIKLALPLHLLLLQQVEASLNAGIAEGVTAIWQEDGHPIMLVVDLGAEGAFNLV